VRIDEVEFVRRRAGQGREAHRGRGSGPSGHDASTGRHSAGLRPGCMSLAGHGLTRCALSRRRTCAAEDPGGCHEHRRYSDLRQAAGPHRRGQSAYRGERFYHDVRRTPRAGGDAQVTKGRRVVPVIWWVTGSMGYGGT
jgi:hypothetical protein